MADETQTNGAALAAEAIRNAFRSPVMIEVSKNLGDQFADFVKHHVESEDERVEVIQGEQPVSFSWTRAYHLLQGQVDGNTYY